MEDLELFDLVALSFDPPEKSAKQVKDMIDYAMNGKGGLRSQFNRATQEPERVDLTRKIKFLEDMAARILTDGGKKLVDSQFKALADKKTQAELEALAATVDLLAMAGEKKITQNTIQHYRKKSRLSDKSVRKVFTDAGFEIIDIDNDPTVKCPKFPPQFELTHSWLDMLSRTKDPNPNGADTSVVTDLYAFAAYLSNDTGNIDLYQAKGTEELRAIFDAASRKFSGRPADDKIGKACGEISPKATSYVFNSEDNRAAYDRYLVYHSKELRELFTKMKRAPESTLLDPEFANLCIGIIRNYFPEDEVALAIYNKEAGLTDPYYWPMEVRYTVKCHYCSRVSEFKSEADAAKANACENCKKPLFRKCGKCGRLVLEGKPTCPYPDCGYVFANAALFSKYFQQAQAAFRQCDFNEARRFLFEAQTAAPGEKAKIEQLAKQIEQTQAVFQKPVSALRRLIAERKFQTAKSELGAVIQQYPSLNVAEFERIISGELARADALFASAGNLPAVQKADVCVTILTRCVDYAPALLFLQATPPEPCGGIFVVPSPSAGVINISWNRTSEQEVLYRLVRKTGRTASASENDGEILADKTTAASFTDERVTPGQAYTYSVFAMRRNVFSPPASRTGVLYSDVKNCHISQVGASVRITWDAPPNSRGATVSRTCGGRIAVLTESAHGSYQDTDIQFGKTYAYRVSANYGERDRSPGIEHVITPLVIIDSFSMQAVPVKDTVYCVSWSIRQPGVDLRVLVNGRLAAEARSDDGSAKVTLPRETHCSISVQAFSGGNWLSSGNTVEVNTYTPCKIDKKATRLEEFTLSGHSGTSYRVDLKIRLSGAISDHVSAFYYALRTTNSQDRWAQPDDVGRAPDIQRIPRELYQKQGCIPCQIYVLRETAFFVTVFTAYTAGGQEILSEPQRARIDRPLNANLFWSVSYGRFDGWKLSVEMSGNKPIEYVPELVLCACEADGFLASPDDRNSRTVAAIPPVELDPSQAEYRSTYPLRPDLPTAHLKRCRFFLFQKETDGGGTIALRWKRGFSGKV